MSNPTGVSLPALVYDRKTRTMGEFYLYYNLGIANFLATLGLDGNSNPQLQLAASCGSVNTNPTSGFGAVRALKAIQSLTDSIWTVNGSTGTLPPSSPPDQAAELGIAVSAINSYAISGANPGDGVEIVMLPNPANDILICYDQGMNMDVGQENRAIGRKFSPVDHFVRQRPDNKISLKSLYCCNLNGLAAIRQRDVTLIGKFFPDGGAIPSEVIYFTNARLNVPLDIPEDSNDSVTVSADGMFGRRLAFTARPV